MTERSLNERRGGVFVLALFAVCIPSSAIAQPATSLKTTYGGGYGGPGDFVSTIIDLSTNNDVLVGKIRQPYYRKDEPPISNIRREGDRLAFEADKVQYDLRQTAHGYSGFVQKAPPRLFPAEA